MKQHRERRECGEGGQSRHLKVIKGKRIPLYLKRRGEGERVKGGGGRANIRVDEGFGSARSEEVRGTHARSVAEAALQGHEREAPPTALAESPREHRGQVHHGHFIFL